MQGGEQSSHPAQLPLAPPRVRRPDEQADLAPGPEGPGASVPSFARGAVGDQRKRCGLRPLVPLQRPWAVHRVPRRRVSPARRSRTAQAPACRAWELAPQPPMAVPGVPAGELTLFASRVPRRIPWDLPRWRRPVLEHEALVGRHCTWFKKKSLSNKGAWGKYFTIGTTIWEY